MMRPLSEVRVYLCVGPVDMRKQAASLALLVEQSLGHDVFDSSLYAFTNRRRDRVRIVYWDLNGLCLSTVGVWLLAFLKYSPLP